MSGAAYTSNVRLERRTGPLRIAVECSAPSEARWKRVRSMRETGG